MTTHPATKENSNVPTVGIVGLGKLGMPTAITLARHGLRVIGYDRDPARMHTDALSPHERNEDLTLALRDEELPGPEALAFETLEHLVSASDCVLIAVETPHGPLHEGTTRLPKTRSDFNYEALVGAIASVARIAPPELPIGIISTVLPGTIRREILPLLGPRRLVYCPQFIAMGSVAHDLCNPEFVLLGYDTELPSVFREIFAKLSRAPVFEVSFESAELAKVIYNTYISSKVAVANLIQVMSHETGADARDVFAIVRAASSRIVGPAYIGPGLGDGGPCHPRDNIALSWLLRKVGFGGDLFTAVMEVREAYADWQAGVLVRSAGGLPIVVLGTSYKPNTGINTGSAAVLLCNLLSERGVEHVVIDRPSELVRLDTSVASAYFIGCPETEFLELSPAPGSVILDPWHVVRPRPGVQTIYVGVPEGAPPRP